MDGRPMVEPIKEIPWDPSMVNRVRLLGNLGRDPEYKLLQSGARVANVSIAVRRGQSQEMRDRGAEQITDWFDLEMWGELADAASRDLFRGMQVAVEGSLQVDKWVSPDGMKRSRVKVRVQSIYRIMPYQDRGAYAAGEQAGAGLGIMGSEEMWSELFANPHSYWDNRMSKNNPKAPDFKNKDTGMALWLSSAPAWVEERLLELPPPPPPPPPPGQVDEGYGDYQPRVKDDDVPF